MPDIKIKNYIIIILSLLIFSVFNSCKSDRSKTEEDVYSAMEIEIDTSAAKMVKFNNTLFSLPSPYQLAIFVKDFGVEYNNEILNSTQNVSNYTNNFKKSINLGIYGADLAYLNIYDQVPDAISYFSVIKLLSQDLGISSAFDASTIRRIEQNMGNKDSLLFIISNTYRSADAYLKANNRNDIGVLVLAGGWIEGLHILLEIAKQNKNDEIINRIGENKQPLENLIKILSPYYNQSDEFTELIDDFIDLATVFDGISIEYHYKESETFQEQKLTMINSKTILAVGEEQFDLINSKIEKIRNNIIN
ncbi:MAG: hypothetical protein KAT68_08960 [Bacteroidales bacterium]|nr:hypothetical protein [Bacteroidales bacterium]